MIPATSQRLTGSVRSLPVFRIRRTPVIPWTTAPGTTTRRGITSVRIAANGKCCGFFRPSLTMSGNTKTGPNTAIAPITCRNSSS